MEDFVLNKKIKFSIILFPIFFSFAFFFIYVFSYSTNNTHPVLTEEAIKFFNAKSDDYEISRDEMEWIKRGAIEEDEPPRYINHFYDPIHNIGWTGKYFGNLTEGEGYKMGVDIAPKLAIDAKNWSQNQEYQAAYGRQYGNQTWQKAIKSLIDGDKKSAFIALGHILHLVEDMSVPDHTRNDSHPGLYSDPGSPYESYTKNYTNFNKLTVADDLINQNKGFVSIGTLNNAFDYLANYSNNNFFSEDTISNNDFMKPDILKLEKQKVIINSIKTIALYDGNTNIYSAFLNKENKYSTNDNSFILSSYRTHLFSQSVLVSASVIDLFFKEAEKFEKNPELLGPIVSDSQGSIVQIIKSSPKIIALKTSDIIDEKLTSAKVFIVKGIENIKQSLTEIKLIFSSTSQTAGPGFLLTDNVEPPMSNTISNTNPAAEPEPEPTYVVDSEQTSIINVSQNQHMRDLTTNDDIEPQLPTSDVSYLENPTPGIIEPKFSFAGPGAPYAGFGGGGAPLPLESTPGVGSDAEPEPEPELETTSPAEPEPESEPEPEIPADTTPPDVSLAVSECANSLSSGSCLVATTTLHISWQSTASDLSYYEFTNNGSVSTTTATSTTVVESDNSTNNFSVRAVDAAGNWSLPQTTTVVVSSMPIVINEVAWAGTSVDYSNDEWVELYNRTSSSINLDNWILYSQTDMGPYINLSGTIAAGGYYLMERKDDETISDIAADLIYGNDGSSWSLNNSGEILTLSHSSTTIDQTVLCGSGPVKWCPGFDYKYKTMEKRDPGLLGSDSVSWSYNNGLVKNGRDAAGQVIYGTPRARNSVNYLIANGVSAIISDTTLTKSNSPYVVNSNRQVFQSDAMLTIEPGVVIKFYNDAGLSFSGNSKIIARGTAEEPIVFTSFDDDSYGGNLDATSTAPTAGGWFGANINTTNNDSVFDHTLFRYGGKYYTSGDYSRANLGIQNYSANVSNSTFESSFVYGIKLTGSNSIVSNNIIKNNNDSGIYISSGNPTISNNTIEQNYRGIYTSGSSSAIDSNVFNSNSNEAISSSFVCSFSNNSGSDNGTNGIVLTGGSSGITRIGETFTAKSNSLPYIINIPSRVVASSTLVVEPGVTFKAGGGFFGGRLDVYGEFLIQGNVASDIIFTSSAATPSAGDWQGIRMNSGSYSNIKGTTISYAEKGIVYENSPINLENVKFENNNLAIQADAGSLLDGAIAATLEFLGNITSTMPAGLLGL